MKSVEDLAKEFSKRYNDGRTFNYFDIAHDAIEFGRASRDEEVEELKKKIDELEQEIEDLKYDAMGEDL